MNEDPHELNNSELNDNIYIYNTYQLKLFERKNNATGEIIDEIQKQDDN